MSDPIQIKRYPNRRYYARHASKYVSLKEIEEMVQAGQTVEIRDSQTGDDLTRVVLTQLIMDRQPDKMSLFPVDMLHFILQSNDVMADFLRDYFRHSLTYLNYLRRHGAASAISPPMHWVKAWLDGIKAKPATNGPDAAAKAEDAEGDAEGDAELVARLKELEARIKQLESKGS